METMDCQTLLKCGLYPIVTSFNVAMPDFSSLLRFWLLARKAKVFQESLVFPKGYGLYT